MTSPAEVSLVRTLSGALLVAVLVSLLLAPRAAAIPETTIESGPTGATADDTPTFTFSADEVDVSFECSVDSAPFGACSNPGSHTTQPLPDGPHTFAVRAVDAASEPDPTPATRSFTVDTTGPADTTGPDTTITKRPRSPIRTERKKATVRVSFTSEAGATFRCKLGGADYKPCTSPYSVVARSKGGKGWTHSISIQAIDEAGNAGEPAIVRFRVRREQRAHASAARRTVTTALKRHGFARRVVKALDVDCRRRGRQVFRCRFEARFPGYRLRGRGRVKLGAAPSYDLRVTAQGVRFTLTDDNEPPRSR